MALAQDAIDFADALGIDRFFIIGHDWGARAAYTIAALYPQRLFALAALSLAYQSGGVFKIPDFEQSRRFWYQWFQCIDEGAEAVRRDPVGLLASSGTPGARQDGLTKPRTLDSR